MQRTLTMLTVGIALASASVLAEETKFVCIDLSSKTNQKLADNQGRGAEGNHLKDVPTGEQLFADIKFRIGEGLIQLGSKLLDNFPEKVVDIRVGKQVLYLHLFHATAFGGGPNLPGTPGYVQDGMVIGEYVVRYEDNSTESIPIIYGEDVRDWFYREDEKDPSRGKVAWRGANDFATQVDAKIRLYVSSWKNPKPNQKVLNIDYVSKKSETVAAPFCLAITVEQN